MKKLYYLPLEPYLERYTWLMSSNNGWTEDHLVRNSIAFRRIDGITFGSGITSGVVVDAFGRPYYAMSQLANVVKMLRDGTIKDGDVIYTEDFWHPGIESLFYIRAITGIDFKIGCFLHAQSVDDTDFTYPMREWMRPMEVGMSKGYDYIFVCSPILKGLCVDAGYQEDHIYVTGLPYNSEKLVSQLKTIYGRAYDPSIPTIPNTVIFSSRFDSEKNPHFFLDLVELCPDVNFWLVNPRRDSPISNDKSVVARLADNKPDNLDILDTHDKVSYYKYLAAADVQFNCAKQDWVSWTLLEAITFRCKPLYPNWKDFPYELDGFPESLYENENLESAREKLMALLSAKFDTKLNKIVEKHDGSWKQYLTIMGF